ncbi:MAG: acyltransferase family protein [Myxococcales bacterium]|nr:acyltransferase family protein [Myxococcales bacterium]
MVADTSTEGARGLRTYQPGDEHRLEPPDPERVGWLLELLDLADRYHRYQVDGLEHVPRTGPALITSYHALTVIDMCLLGRRIFLRDRRLPRALTDKLMFSFPVIRDLFATLGVVVGTQDNAVGLLRAGELSVCMPGGGLEWARSSRQRYQLRWGDHRGYARLAIRTGVAIIPTACPAADRVFVVPYDGWKAGELARRWLGLSRTIPLPLPLGLPFGLPIRLTQRVGAPIWPDAPPEAADDPAEVARLDERVRAVIRELLARG